MTGGMKAPSEGGLNTTMDTFSSGCAHAWFAQISAVASAGSTHLCRLSPIPRPPNISALSYTSPRHPCCGTVAHLIAVRGLQSLAKAVLSDLAIQSLSIVIPGGCRGALAPHSRSGTHVPRCQKEARQGYVDP